MKKVFLALALFTYAGSMATSTYAAVTGTEVVKKTTIKEKRKRKKVLVVLLNKVNLVLRHNNHLVVLKKQTNPFLME
jgi:hypothetical protein